VNGDAAGRAIRRIQIEGPTLGEPAARRLRRDVGEAIGGGASALILDCGAVTSFEAPGISGLLVLRERAPAEVRWALAALSPAGQALARELRLHQIFDVYADVEAAARDLSE
jgi:anti-anti-sigma regulatory factor